MKAGYTWLAILAVVMSAVSLFYYFRIAAAMFFTEGSPSKLRVELRSDRGHRDLRGGHLVIGVAPQPFLSVLKSLRPRDVAGLGPG